MTRSLVALMVVVLAGGCATSAPAGPAGQASRVPARAPGIPRRHPGRERAECPLHGARGGRHAVRRHPVRAAPSTPCATRWAAIPSVLKFAEGLTMPNGVALHEGALYVAEQKRLIRYPAAEASLDKPPQAEVVDAALPFKGALHSWKYLAVGPDGKLYVPVGAPCNVCVEPGFRRDPPDEPGRDGPRGGGVGHSQFGRPDLAPDDEGAVVHRQWPRHAGRRRAAVRAESRAPDGPRLRLSRIVTAARSRIPSSGRPAAAAPRCRRCRRWARMSRRWP